MTEENAKDTSPRMKAAGWIAGFLIIGFLVLLGLRFGWQGKPSVDDSASSSAVTTQAQLPEPVTQDTESREGAGAVTASDAGTNAERNIHDTAIDTAATEETVNRIAGQRAGTLVVASTAIGGGNRRIALNHTCHRENATPPVSWSKAPRGTKSYVVFLEQRKNADQPVLYWAVFNIPADQAALPANMGPGPSFPDGSAYAANDLNAARYTGPCDPRGQVDYAFKVFALDSVLDLPAGSSKGSLIAAMQDHILDEAELPFIHYVRL